MKIFDDIYNLFSMLEIVDLIFFAAIITLLILIVTLVYFIKINKEVLSDSDSFPPSNNNDNFKESIIEDKKEDLMNLIEENMSPKEVEKQHEREEEYNDEEAPLMDLESLTKKLQSQVNDERVTCTEYEKDQEEKAIISYDELLQKHNKYAINYEKEEVIDDLIIKKVNLNDLVNKNKIEDVKEEVRVISYQKEEAFLDALKELNRLLN